MSIYEDEAREEAKKAYKKSRSGSIVSALLLFWVPLLGWYLIICALWSVIIQSPNYSNVQVRAEELEKEAAEYKETIAQMEWNCI